MQILKVKECCCGCSLEVGAKIIGWMDIVCGIAVVIIWSIVSTYSPDDLDKDNLIYSEVNIILQILSGISSIILGVLLLVGVAKRSPRLCNIWNIVSLTGTVVYAILTIVQVILAITAGRYIAGKKTLALKVAGVLLNYYCVMIVSSFRKEILSNN